MRFPALYWLAAISLAPAACVRTPDSYPAPEQHAPPNKSDGGAADFLTFDTPAVATSVVKDVFVDEPGPWRWTAADPEVRFALSSNGERTLLVDFAINDRTFRDTGPVTVSFYVNDHLASEERYTTYGDKSYEKRIPAAWLNGRSETRVRLHVDKVWPSPGGRALGILLKRVGFTE